jgi:hypothetical protein
MKKLLILSSIVCKLIFLCDDYIYFLCQEELTCRLCLINPYHYPKYQLAKVLEVCWVRMTNTRLALPFLRPILPIGSANIHHSLFLSSSTSSITTTKEMKQSESASAAMNLDLLLIQERIHDFYYTDISTFLQDLEAFEHQVLQRLYQLTFFTSTDKQQLQDQDDFMKLRSLLKQSKSSREILLALDTILQTARDYLASRSLAFHDMNMIDQISLPMPSCNHHQEESRPSSSRSRSSKRRTEHSKRSQSNNNNNNNNNDNNKNDIDSSTDITVEEETRALVKKHIEESFLQIWRIGCHISPLKQLESISSILLMHQSKFKWLHPPPLPMTSSRQQDLLTNACQVTTRSLLAWAYHVQLGDVKARYTYDPTETEAMDEEENNDDNGEKHDREEEEEEEDNYDQGHHRKRQRVIPRPKGYVDVVNIQHSKQVVQRLLSEDDDYMIRHYSVSYQLFYTILLLF